MNLQTANTRQVSLRTTHVSCKRGKPFKHNIWKTLKGLRQEGSISLSILHNSIIVTKQKQIIKKQGKDFANLEKRTRKIARIETRLILQKLKIYCSDISKSFMSDMTEMFNSKGIAISDSKPLIKEETLSIFMLLVQTKVSQRRTNVTKPREENSSSL